MPTASNHADTAQQPCQITDKVQQTLEHCPSFPREESDLRIQECSTVKSGTWRIDKDHSVAWSQPTGAGEIGSHILSGVVGAIAGDHIRYIAIGVQIAIHRPVCMGVQIPPHGIDDPVPVL